VTRKLTVSEFIRETKPDWQHVAKREKQATTGAFSGATVVRVSGPRSRREAREYGPAEPFADQMDAQDRQALGLEEPMALWDEETVDVDDFGQEVKVVGKVGSRVPR
jgi:hypothetical protein